MGLVPASVRPCVRGCVRVCVHTFKHEYLRDQQPITTKFYLNHHWGWGKAPLGFGADQIRTLVSMETDSSHFWTVFDRILFLLAVNYDIH